VQGLLKLEESTVSLRCRREDEAAVKNVLHSAVEDYQRKSGKSCKVTIDTVNYLPPAPTGSEDAHALTWYIPIATKFDLLTSFDLPVAAVWC
jgi:uncharacterized heparinase superfamily protein